MLYDRWRQIAREFRSELALVDQSSGRRWTFEELALGAESAGPPRDISFPTGIRPEFIFSVLRSWSAGAVVCPLEPGQATVQVRQLPPGCVHLKTTSASTGVPRLIAFTAAQLAADADQIVATMGLRRDWPNVAVVSIAHSYGFSNLVLPLLLHGIPLVLASSPLPESVRQAAGLFPEVTLPGVPALWRAWVEAHAVPGNVRLGLSAGAPLPVALERLAFATCGVKIHNFYGASECGGIAYDATDVPRSDAACVGAPMRGVELSTTDEGCLTVRGAAVGLTYWPEPSPSLLEGVYQSSDLARIDIGLVYLSGRQSDQINVAGRKVSPESIERALARHEAVRECLVFGAPSVDADRTEIVVACVILKSHVGPEALKQHLLESLPAWQVPRDWWFVDSLKTNVRGKLSRAEWRRKYLERHKGPLA